jgi:hypothetical protein
MAEETQVSALSNQGWSGEASPSRRFCKTSESYCSRRSSTRSGLKYRGRSEFCARSVNEHVAQTNHVRYSFFNGWVNQTDTVCLWHSGHSIESRTPDSNARSNVILAAKSLFRLEFSGCIGCLLQSLRSAGRELLPKTCGFLLQVNEFFFQHMVEHRLRRKRFFA